MSTKKNIPHLLDEPPISVYPSLAKALGNVNKAIILQQLHFLLNVAKLSKNSYVEVDGKWWVYNSYQQWQKDHFPWLAVVTIKKLFRALEKDGLIISRQGVKQSTDRRKWYTIDYDAYLDSISCMGQKVSDVDGIKSISSDGQKVSDDSSETPSETPSEKITRPKRERDALWDAISTIWDTTAPGQIAVMRSMFLGIAKRGEWKTCNFDPPTTAEELTRFGIYAKRRVIEQHIPQFPTSPITIQRWFYDFRRIPNITLLDGSESDKSGTAIPSGHSQRPASTLDLSQYDLDKHWNPEELGL